MSTYNGNNIIPNKRQYLMCNNVTFILFLFNPEHNKSYFSLKLDFETFTRFLY